MTTDRPPPPKFDLAFTDVETSGIDEKEHQILELAIVRLDPRTMVEKQRYHRYFMPTKPVPEEAARINGYSEALWRERGAEEMRGEDLTDIGNVLHGAAFAGQVVGFDKRFLWAAHDRMARPYPTMDYHMIDIAVFGWPLVIAGRTRGLSLKYTRKFFGLPGEQAHTALCDVLDEIEVYKFFMQAYMNVWEGWYR